MHDKNKITSRDVLNKIEAYAALHNMLGKGDRVVAGVSGGADSHCLLHVLCELRDKLDLKITAVHVNHGIRGAEADSDEAFVRKICRSYGVECKIFHFDVPKYAAENGLTVEEAGRKLRYEAFESTAKGENGESAKIAVAHNMNDNCETMIMRFFRGTGIKGLGGISPVRGSIIRPLLCVSREEIELYCDQNMLTYCTDSTNSHTDYTRNNIRLKLLPEIEKDFNPSINRVMFRTAEIIRQENIYIEREAEKAYKVCSCGENKIDINLLNKYDAVLKRRIIRKGFEPFLIDLHDVAFEHIEAVLSLTEKKSGKIIQLPHNLRAAREYNAIKFYTYKEPQSFCRKVNIDEPIEIAGNVFFVLTKNKMKSYSDKIKLDYDKLKTLDSLVLRTKLDGDKIYLKGVGSKAVKKIFSEKKLSADEKNSTLMLADKNDVVWLQNLKTSGLYKADKDTADAVYIYIYCVNK